MNNSRNIGGLLGLDDDSELLELAAQRWGTWTADHPPLRVVDDFVELRTWLRGADREAADAVLLPLAMLASPDGGDDVAAAAALAKCLLPGVCTEAGRLSDMLARGQINGSVSGSGPGHVNELIASQLWIEVRSFPWRRLTKVAANILVNTRIGVLRELGDNAQVWRTDRTWANTSLLDDWTAPDPAAATGAHEPDASSMAGMLGDPALALDHQTPLEELLDVLAWACEHDVISVEDRSLLLCLVEEAAQVETRRLRRGRGGLAGNELSARVAPLVGVSEATVRRRTSKSIRALAAAAPDRFVGHD
ncbi:hypothetical protein BSP109_02212 [Brevibacterium sp. Mu109]|uniref:hypothetical protein n=1 Tax=Brevibacterium sp. Mu109 TaxID=1255669 RepID=UPI000C528146|nr:hypothetical protein [Brevibacterium sp. Mu109]MDN5894107.1 hypothetical protein [Nocardioides sp.]SMX87414.1 hypothetical protein BSP109_02212 [Brevibacterium sp. Mu109]